MFLDKRPALKRKLGRIFIGLIFLSFLFCVYAFSAIYFEQVALTKKVLKDIDSARPVSRTIISKKVDEKISSFYSFFFDLPKAESSPDNLDYRRRRDLYLGVFSYTTAMVDYDKTNLSFEGVSNAIAFKPDYKWEQVGQELLSRYQPEFDRHAFNSFSGPYDDKRCIKDNCLEVKNGKILYNDKSLLLPSGIKAKDIHAISLGLVESKWLVGFTLKKNGYEGQVFYFDGLKFSQIPGLNNIYSEYPGLFGFGGTKDDFLIIYGAYKGKAFRVQGEKISNLDKFFSYRVMNKGFKPEVIRAQSDNYINWYIYSSTIDNPHFLKLWQDKKGEIVGIMSLLADLGIKEQTIELKLVESALDHVSLISKAKEGGHESWHLFKDFGFLNEETKMLISLPTIYDSTDADNKMYINAIKENSIHMDEQGKEFVKMEFSLDGSAWQAVRIGKNFDFIQEPTNRYFLKIIFSPTGDKFYSPYISMITFSYLYNK